MSSPSPSSSPLSPPPPPLELTTASSSFFSKIGHHHLVVDLPLRPTFRQANCVTARSRTSTSLSPSQFGFSRRRSTPSPPHLHPRRHHVSSATPPSHPDPVFTFPSPRCNPCLCHFPWRVASLPEHRATHHHRAPRRHLRPPPTASPPPSASSQGWQPILGVTTGHRAFPRRCHHLPHAPSLLLVLCAMFLLPLSLLSLFHMGPPCHLLLPISFHLSHFQMGSIS